MSAEATLTASTDGRTRTRGLVACLAFAALTGSVVAGLGQPLVLEISRVRGVSIAAAQWSLIMTLLVGVVATPILSRLADGRSRRAVLVGALLVVALGSLVGGAVPTFPGLLVARALQGLGYAMVPLTLIIAREHLAGPVMHRTLGVLSTSIAVGVGLGNPVVGLCVLLLDYRAAFLVAFLVSASGAAWVWRRVPPPHEGLHRVSVDLPGALLLAGGLACVLLAVTRGGFWGWASWPVVGCAVLGLFSLLGWVVVELRHPSPLVDLRLSTSAGVIGANVAALLLGFTVFGGASATILLSQRTPSGGLGLGLTVFATGLVMTPMALASLVSPPVARWLARRIGVRRVLPLGAVVVALSFGLFAVWHDEVWQVVVMMAVMGIGIGTTYSVIPAVIVARTPVERTASATGINQVLRLVGGSVGAAVTAALVSGGEAYVAALLVASAMGCCAALAGWLLVPGLVREPPPVDSPVDPN